MPEVCETPGRQQRWQPVLLSNIARGDFSKGEPDIDLPAREAAMRTSAAPTFFPLHGGYADGAIFANNPSLVGVAKMKAHYPHLKMAEMRVLSIGTGGFPYSIDLHGNNDADWGLRQWAPHLVDMLFDASAVNVRGNHSPMTCLCLPHPFKFVMILLSCSPPIVLFLWRWCRG